MSRTRVRLIACDKPQCTARFFTGKGSTPVTALRHQARTAGWRKDGAHDYCPSHTQGVR